MQRSCAARRDIQLLRRNKHRFIGLAAAGEDELDIDSALGRYEVQMILQRNPAVGQISRSHAQRAQHVLVFQQAGMGRTVGGHQAVGAEVAVVQHLTEVATIAIALPALVILADGGRMIAPLPHERAADARLALHQAEIILQVSRPVAHGMAILAHDIGLAHRMLAEIAIDFLQRWIHAAVQIQIAAVDIAPFRREGRALIVRQAGRIKPLCPGQRVFKVHAHAGLVTHGINHHAGAVLIADRHALHAIQHHRAKGWIIRHAVVFLIIGVPAGGHHAMALQISLVQHINAQFIAQLIEQRRLRIMTGTDGVDIVRLHHQ